MVTACLSDSKCSCELKRLSILLIKSVAQFNLIMGPLTLLIEGYAVKLSAYVWCPLLEFFFQLSIISSRIFFLKSEYSFIQISIFTMSSSFCYNSCIYLSFEPLFFWFLPCQMAFGHADESLTVIRQVFRRKIYHR